MGIYTERKISPVQGFFILAAAFASLYGVWLLTGGTELVRSEGVYAAAAAEFDIHGPAAATIHQWATPECFPLFPLVAHLLNRHIGLPMETALRGLSIAMLFGGTVLVYLAASGRRSCTAGWVAAAMYFGSILALHKSVVGTPATGNAFFLLAAQLLFFEYGVRRSNWNLAWIFAALLIAAGFFNGGVEVPVFFIFPMFFLRRPLSVSTKFRKVGFIAAIVIVAAAVLWWVRAYNAWPKRIQLYDIWWRDLAMTGHLKNHFRELWSFPFRFVFMLLPWCVIAWMPFCVALQTLDSTPIFSRYLRTLVFANLALLWLLPELDRGAYFYVIGPLAILTGEFYELGMRRYGGKLRGFLVLAEVFMATVLIGILAGSFLPGELFRGMTGLGMAFRETGLFRCSVAAMAVIAGLLIWYVHACRRSDPVWMIILSVSLALGLFFNGMMLPYFSQDYSKRNFGAEIRAALWQQHDRIGDLYTLKVSNLNGGLFYAGLPVRRLESVDELSRDRDELPAAPGNLYLLCPEVPQSAEFSWENLLPKNYMYNERPLALWKGTPRRPDDGAADENNGDGMQYHRK